jgi:hypothetical protein
MLTRKHNFEMTQTIFTPEAVARRNASVRTFPEYVTNTGNALPRSQSSILPVEVHFNFSSLVLKLIS